MACLVSHVEDGAHGALSPAIRRERPPSTTRPRLDARRPLSPHRTRRGASLKDRARQARDPPQHPNPTTRRARRTARHATQRRPTKRPYPLTGFTTGDVTLARFRMNASRVGIGISTGSPFFGRVICVGPRRAITRSQALRAASRSKAASRRSTAAPSGSPRSSRNRADSSRSATRRSWPSATAVRRLASFSAACVGVSPVRCGS